ASGSLRAAFASITRRRLLLLGQERDEIRELLLGQVRERRRHHVLVAGFDVGAGVGDRRLGELLERALIGLLRVLRKLVEVGADRPVGAGRPVGVAAAAAQRREQPLSRNGIA